jgi:hypothetical protein
MTDRYVAFTMMEVVETLAHLQDAMTALRYDVCVNGDHADFQQVKLNSQKLRRQVDALEHALEHQGETVGGEA